MLALWIGNTAQSHSNCVYLVDYIGKIIIVQNDTMELLSSRLDIIVQLSLLIWADEGPEVSINGFLHCDWCVLLHIILYQLVMILIVLIFFTESGQFSLKVVVGFM